MKNGPAKKSAAKTAVKALTPAQVEREEKRKAKEKVAKKKARVKLAREKQKDEAAAEAERRLLAPMSYCGHAAAGRGRADDAALPCRVHAARAFR